VREDEPVPDPTIVLLHGQPDSSASFGSLWRELRARLSPRVRVFIPDRPGYGANPLPATDFAGNVSWLRRWLAGAGIGPVLLVGHSWAGGVAALAAAEDGMPVAGLVLLCSVGPFCLQPIDPLLGMPLIGEALSYTALQLARPVIGRRARSTILSNLADPDRPYAVTSGAAMRHRPIWRSFLLEQRALLRDLPVITRALSQIAVATRVISGTHDTLIPARTPQALVAAIPGAVRISIEGAHDLQLRQASEVAEAVAGFAAEVLP
jgi:pimeloyl-ACP methyl ester carboxylesterase